MVVVVADLTAICRSLTGAWIETFSMPMNFRAVCVAPSRGRGLKHGGLLTSKNRRCRRSLTGAWIETLRIVGRNKSSERRSLTGAWIETLYPRGEGIATLVAPSRGRGLKQ